MQKQTAASPIPTWRLMNVAWKKMLEAPANFGSQLVAWPPVASRMEASYERAKRSHEAILPRLCDADARIVEDLNKSGVSITSLEAMGLEGVDGLLADVGRGSPDPRLLSGIDDSVTEIRRNWQELEKLVTDRLALVAKRDELGH